MPEARLPSPATGPPRSILILKPSSFGDIVHTLPAVAWLKSVWPAARITWLVNPEWMPLLDGNPDLGALIPFPRREFRGWNAWAKFHRWQRQNIRHLRPDLVLDFQGLFRSALIGRLSAPRALYGLADAREGARWFYDRSTPIPAGVPHSVERYLALAKFAVEQYEPLSKSPVPSLRFSLPDGDALIPDDAASLPGEYVLVHPFARGAGKSLAMTQVQELCRQLAPRKVVLVGRRPGHDAVAPKSCLDLLDRTTLLQLIGLIRHAKFVISVDSGPAHLAAALGRPMVAIHTWSDPRRVGPYRPDAWVWKTGQLVQMRDLPTMPPTFFASPPPELTSAHLTAVSALVTSLSDSCA